METWRIILLGEMRARCGEREITRFNSQKTAGLLAFLAYHLKQIHSREVLIDLFWPESTPEAGRNSLSVALSTLRSQMEPPGTLSGAVIRADRYSVGLFPSAVTTDVIEFESALQSAAKTRSRIEQIQYLSQALDLYGGRLLPGYYDAWIPAEEERIAGRFFDATNQLLSLLEEAGDLPTALAYARKAVSMDPLREETHQMLMRLLAAVGQPGAALRQYKELERLLEEEMGEEPSAPLRALAREIEKQSGLTAPALPVPIASPVPIAGPLIPQTGQPATLTFLLTDIEGSTREWERTGDPYKTALATHHSLLRQQFAVYGGQETKEAGDGFLVAFQSARKGLLCAVACQQALADHAWPEQTGPLKVRMALHTGDVERTEGDYRGLALHQASRMLTAGHGGQILCSEATASLVRRDLEESGLRLADLGIYRLRDIPSPERLFQVEYPQMLQRQFGPLAAEAGYASRLPLRFTRFFGRKHEIAQLTEMLSLHPRPASEGEAEDPTSSSHPITSSPHHLIPASSPRLVTLQGIGGTGKTRLSLEVGERLEQEFQGAVWFVPLADLQDPALMATTILSSLGVPRSPQQDPMEQVIESLRKQPCLLILDNMEQLVEGGAQVVQRLLERVPDLKILATSRQSLRLAAEHEFTLSPLPTPNGEEELASLRLYESVELFIDRAQQVKPDFQVTNANASAVAALVEGLEGIPLAIELAAARTQVFTPSHMLSQLSQRFSFLVSRRRDVSERHRTLKAAIEWSYRLLPLELQRFFARLSVFQGGWSVEAAEAVCEEPLTLDYLALLRECSLVLVEESEQGMRFRMLETIRDYAAEQLTEEERVVQQRRHLSFFLALAEEARPKLSGPEKVGWLNRLENEQDNLRAALDFCREDLQEGKAGLRLSASLQRFWLQRGHLSEGREWLTQVLTHAGAQEWTKVRAAVLNGAGALAFMQVDLVEARTFFEESLAIMREIDDRQGISGLLHNLGEITALQGDYASARSFYEQSLAIGRESGEKGLVRFALFGLGKQARLQGDLKQARELLEECFRLDREGGGLGGSVQVELGLLAMAEGDYEEARRLFEGYLMGNRNLGTRHDVAVGLEQLALLAAHQQKGWEWAACLWGAAEAIRQAIEAPLAPDKREEYERNVAAAREALGDEAFAAAWEAGRAMTWEEAVAFALTQDEGG